MAWPKPRNRRSPAQVEASSTGGGGAPDGARLHAVGPEAAGPGREAAGPGRGAGRPGWPSAERWPGAHPKVAPVAEETDPGVRPFWESWGRPDDGADLDEPGDTFPEDGLADDAVTDVDPRPARSWEPVVAAAGEAREEPKPEGIGQHLSSVAHLSANPRRRAWQR